jgi:enoyl-CoA hydratase/carnithine racemase
MFEKSNWALQSDFSCDIVVASPNASFGLPEALRGVYAGLGGPARLIRNCGLQVSSEIASTGRRVTAQEALGWNLINKISRTPETLIEEAVVFATRIAEISPDAVIVTRAALRESWETASVERATCGGGEIV